MKINCLVLSVRDSIILTTHRVVHVCIYTIVGKSRRLPVDDIENEFLKTGWLPDTVEHGTINAHAISDTAKSGREWVAEQVERGIPGCLTTQD
jgi:hypothetical protein